VRTRKEERQTEALRRQAEYEKLTVNEKIRRAQSRRGESRKELRKLMAMKESSQVQ
jgi:hypothetical protein